MQSNTTRSVRLRSFVGKSCCSAVLLLAVACSTAWAAATQLATVPITSSDSVRARPNILFVLDDSGSMDADFLPDWAGPYQQADSASTIVVTPAHRFFNNAFNGVAYNPGTRYRPPVNYDANGGRETTTYPTMSGESVAQGGDASASTAGPNWRAVKKDAFGVQSTLTNNIEGGAFFYTTIPGEYCDSQQLRNCIAATAPSGAYIYPARLRWCTTPQKAIASTKDSNGYCQAANIDSTAANLVAGVTHYTFPRMPGPPAALIKVGAAGTVTGITVAGQQILSGSASMITASELAMEIARKINECTLATPGNCQVAGYSAVSADVKIRSSSSDEVVSYVTIFAQGTTTATPVVTGGGDTTAFAFATVPGSSVYTPIVSTQASYPYPGSTVKGANRSDCVGTVCTYAEEMTNYANWYTYYRTRMQMMKTNASIAFQDVDDTFRVGYFSINNGAGNQFLDVSDFDGPQKSRWYQKFFGARPSGATPLRTGLSNAGRIYGGLLTSLNGIGVTDPMLYSCQQNFTILSTDGYWNDTSLPVKLDGTSPIENQDNNLDRPFYDGGKWTKTISRTMQSEVQWGLNEFVLEKMEQQLQTSTELIQKIVTTASPYRLDITPLRTRTTPLMQKESWLKQVEYPLYEIPTVLTRYTQYYQKTTSPLNSYTNKLRETTEKLNITAQIRVVQRRTPLQYKEYKITKTTTDLLETIFLITKVTSQLQRKRQRSNNRGDSWFWESGWSDASSCEPRDDSAQAAFVDSVLVKGVQCRYVDRTTRSGESSCTVKAPTAGTYDIANPVSCTYEDGTPHVVSGSSYTEAKKQTSVANNALYSTAKTYAYKTTANQPVTGLDNCDAVRSTASPWVGPAVSCDWDSSSTGNPVDVTSGTCNDSTPSMGSPGVKTKRICGYTGTPTDDTVDECQVKFSYGSPYTELTKVMCAYATNRTSSSNVTSCTKQGTVETGAAPGSVYRTYRECGFDTASTTSPTGGSDSCTFSGGVDGNDYTGPKVTCSYLPPALTASSVAGCTSGSAGSGSASGTILNKYTSCQFGAGVTPAGQNLSSCTGSGGSSGSTYTGPQVTCSYMPTTSSAADPSCQASGTAYSSALVSCGYADGTTKNPVTTCTASASGATGTRCEYGAGQPSASVTSCEKVAQTSSGTTYSGPARDCDYVDQQPQEISGSCEVKEQDTGNKRTGPARQCYYGATPADWAAATGKCTVVPQSSSGSSRFVGPAVECAYNGETTQTPMGSDCSALAEDPGTSFDIMAKKVCVTASNAKDQASTSTATVSSCVEKEEMVGGSKVTTTCTYLKPSIVPSSSCSESGGVVDSMVGAGVEKAYTTKVTCDRNNLDKTYEATYDCTPAGSLSAGTFDATGLIRDCRRTDIQGSALAFKPVASCTEGVTRDDSNHHQTQCRKLVDTPPTAVDPTTCTSDVSGTSSNDYKSIYCTPDTATATTSGCSVTTPSAPQWATTTCVSVPNTGTDNTLADVAAYYYYTDLRTPNLGNCKNGTLCSASDAKNDVFTTATDPASWQHMTTFTLGLGASGYMTYQEQYLSQPGDYATVYGDVPHHAENGITADPDNGICSWQSTGQCDWPYPAADQQTTIDDLWHAGVNGHGAYFSAADPQSLSSSLSRTIENISAAGGASAAPAISTPMLTPADNYLFGVTYKTLEWTGELVRRQLDPYTGQVASTIDWSAQAKLDGRPAAARNIYTFDESVPVTRLKAFTSANFATDDNFLRPHISTVSSGLTQFVCASESICVPSALQANAAGANLVDYLRGVRTYEGAENDNTTYYRQRQHVLGDIVNAQAVYVNKSLYSYGDPGYGAFVSNIASRAPVVYVGGNDGMLHAFAAKGSAATEAKVEAAAQAASAAYLDPTQNNRDVSAQAKADAEAAIATDVSIGQELWAYIPSMVLPELYRLADKKYKNQHRYFVDASPVAADICVRDCAHEAGAVWKKILVGGLGGGGRGYYALDITMSGTPKAMWEFTDDNLGYSYGNPQVAKLSDGTWVVLVASGYNNIPNGSFATGDGVGRLFVINAATGALIREISTGVGDTGTPSGLAKITAEVANPASDNTIEAVYGGDLLGNLWRFDVNDAIGAAGYEAQLLAALKDASGNAQPITSKPEVTQLPKTRKNVVYVGTGRFLHADDSRDKSQQSMYAIKDDRTTGATPRTAIFDSPGGDRSNIRSASGFIRQIHSEVDCSTAFASNICVAGEKVRSSTDNAVDWAADNGWYFDFLGLSTNDKSERLNTDPTLALGILALNTNAPTTESCDLGGKSFSYYVDYLTGGPIHSSENYIPSTHTGVVGKFVANEFASTPTFFVDQSGSLKEVFGLSGGGTTVSQPPQGALGSPMRRTSWRELIAD